MAVTTLGQFRAAVAAELGLDNDADGDQPNIDRWVNEGYEDFVRRTHCKVTWDDVPLTAGESRYELPAQTLAVLELTNADGRSLERVTLQEIDQLHRGDVSAYAGVWRYATAGYTYLRVWPTPSEASNLTMTYVPRPAPIEEPDDPPSAVPAEFHQAIEFYAEARAARYDNHGPSQFGATYMVLYEQAVHECRSAASRKGGNRRAAAVPGNPQRTALPSDPSVIVW